MIAMLIEGAHDAVELALNLLRHIAEAEVGGGDCEKGHQDGVGFHVHVVDDTSSWGASQDQNEWNGVDSNH